MDKKNQRTFTTESNNRCLSRLWFPGARNQIIVYFYHFISFIFDLFIYFISFLCTVFPRKPASRGSNYPYCHKGKISKTHWGRVTHICVGKPTTIGSDNGLSPGRRQAINWTNAEMLLIGPLGTNFSDILIVTESFSFKEKHLQMSAGKCRPFCLGLNVFTLRRLAHCFLGMEKYRG